MSKDLTSSLSRTYNSFSGCDIHATFGGSMIGELQGVSYTVTREKAPIYTMGSVDCRGYSRGKRGIAGSLVFAVFDRSALLETLRRDKKTQFITDLDELAINARRTGNSTGTTNASAGAASHFMFGSTAPTELNDGFYEDAPAWYLDQIPPFNIVLNAVNEYGHRMRQTIWNVEILNNGSGISIDDIMIDESMTWVATNISPWETGKFGSISDPMTARGATNYKR